MSIAVSRQPAWVSLEGVIAADPNTESTEAPLALVCEFPRAVEPEVLKYTHRLAWNLSRTALLITLEPHQLIAWSCYQNPLQPEDERRVCELPTPAGFQPTGTQQERDVRNLLHWVNLVTQRWQAEEPSKFPAAGRADASLLKNLRYVRSALLSMGLPHTYTAVLELPPVDSPNTAVRASIVAAAKK